MEQGKIILLNGVSSSGKTSVAKAIQDAANEHFYHICNDMFVKLEVEMLCAKFVAKAGKHGAYSYEYMAESCVLMYHFAKTMVGLGINVIFETMLCDTEGFLEKYNMSNLDIFHDILKGLDIFMVELFCPLDECSRRNVERGDRGINQSTQQHELMHKNIQFDFSVDTSIHSAEECADKILSIFYRT
ncbi:MAG: chloramphenicol phosphotransferase CPT family protein [Defluviitaleaceae bacterium]|nr:chloramphenicol phosphotransferase CPT family protein [Defluviitaleaceae bacterium]MCL2238564.1 chloramphenicol phosphotransferase CPT family protein [Defluviitaleaceae bacterium]